jgi:hypothetical protein
MLLVPSVGFMLLIEGFLKAEMLAMVGSALAPESRLRYDKLTISVS